MGTYSTANSINKQQKSSNFVSNNKENFNSEQQQERVAYGQMPGILDGNISPHSPYGYRSETNK